jgi:hypothetical protein
MEQTWRFLALLDCKFSQQGAAPESHARADAHDRAENVTI